MAPPRITSFLVKVASRCNLDCDYCYVYHHADQSWRSMPKRLAADTWTAFCERLDEYLRASSIEQCSVIFHGGEPLLVGAETLARFANEARTKVRAKIAFGLQTNGLLLTGRALETLADADIAVSLSLDGPQYANDLHRVTPRGKSSFARVLAALERLKLRPETFAGIIAVIDPRVRPRDVLEFFAQHHPPKLDFLLPDAHHLRPPPGRTEDSHVYRNWLIDAFDLWLDEFSHLPVRTFEALLDAVAGLPSTTDAFGLGDVSLITIETDGTYHDLDVFKVAFDGATRLNGSVFDTKIIDVANSPALERHRLHLRREGLCPQCQACPEVAVCGGGSLPHRYGADGFDHPTIYCAEMLALIGHIRHRLAELTAPRSAGRRPGVPADGLIESFDLAERAVVAMNELCADASACRVEEFAAAIACLARAEDCGEIAERWAKHAARERALVANWPGAIAWQRVVHAQSSGRRLHSVDGSPLSADAAYARDLLSRPALENLDIGTGDAWLRKPFGKAIVFEDEDVVARAEPVAKAALGIIEAWRPALGAELRLASKTIQFVRDPLAHPEKIVSFSDDAVPGALFVSVTQGERLIDPHDLADSLIHEHRHQKLYLLERRVALTSPSSVKVVSPWREDLRPPSGLLHAVFVFVELRRFWIHLRDFGPALLKTRAIQQLRDTERNLEEAFHTLKSCPMTDAGKTLAAFLEHASQSDALAA